MKKLLPVILLIIAAFGTERFYTYWLVPQKISQRQYITRSFTAQQVVKSNNNLFIFGNFQNNDRFDAAVFALYPEPTLKRLSDSGSLKLLGVHYADTCFIITGTTPSEYGTTGWIGKVDELGNLMWTQTLGFEYSNNLCCAVTLDSVIIAAGSLYDKEGTANLQMIVFSHQGKLIDGKSFLTGYDFQPVKIFGSGNKIIVAGNIQEEKTGVLFMIFDQNLQLIQRKTIPAGKSGTISDILPVNDGFIATGRDRDQLSIVKFDTTFNIVWQKSIPTTCKFEQGVNIQKSGPYYVVSTLCSDSQNNAKTRILAVSGDGYLQWTLPYQSGISRIIASSRYITNIVSDGTSIIIETYKKKINAIWTKTFGSSQTDSLLATAFSSGKLTVLTAKNNKIKLYGLSPTGLVIQKQELNLNPANIKNISNDKSYIYILHQPGNQLTIIRSDYSTVTKKIQTPALLLDFKPARYGFIATGIDTTTPGKCVTVRYNRDLSPRWEQSFEFDTHITGAKVIPATQGLAVFVKTRQKNGYGYTLLSYDADGNLIFAKNYLLPEGKNNITAIHYLKGFYIAVDQGTYGLVIHTDENGEILWEKVLPVQNLSGMVIFRQKPVIVSGTEDFAILTYLSADARELKNVQYNGADGTNAKLATTGYIYLTLPTNITGENAIVTIKTR